MRQRGCDAETAVSAESDHSKWSQFHRTPRKPPAPQTLQRSPARLETWPEEWSIRDKATRNVDRSLLPRPSLPSKHFPASPSHAQTKATAGKLPGRRGRGGASSVAPYTALPATNVLTSDAKEVPWDERTSDQHSR